ncbi:MAG TPA: aminotransferase class I/II-fold pyridoxal phosphate-dependent enzyme [Vicinamibacteria bacterium]|nr:aminotransferase class I/II-fold pyridoxal phosphate-dependent enzyme [Vicinamibacteria bacterium]
MSLSRRNFVKTLGVGAAGAYAATIVSTRRQEAIAFAASMGLPLDQVINLANNENPMGPGKVVLGAIEDSLGPNGTKPGRYPFSYEGPLHEAIAKKWNVKPENVLLGAGSTQILVDATHCYTSRDKALVGSLPTYEECFGYATLIGNRTKAVPLTADYRMDLDKTMYACKGSGMLFYCNPNNPVASLVNPADTKEFIPRALKANKELRILVDEAYIDYVTTPGHETLIPMAVSEPRLIVARTFSKAYGMAGLRIGYAIAHEKTIEKLSEFHMGNSVSSVSYAGAIAAIERDAVDSSYLPNERKRNDDARSFTIKWFADRGYQATDAQTNFIFVDVQQPVEDFQEACRKEGVRVGRPFPPLWTHCRISIGTMEEMKRAVEVFDRALAASKAQAA